MRGRKMKMLPELLLSFAIILVVQALPEDDQTIPATNEDKTEEPVIAKEDKGALEECTEVMANNGLNFSSFWHGAAHGIHSINLEEIRHYFEPGAPCQNDEKLRPLFAITS